MVNRTDEETADLIIEWLRKYALLVVAGLIFGVGGLYGYNVWHEKKINNAKIASQQVEQLFQSFSKKDYAFVLKNYSKINEDGAIKSLSLLIAGKSAYQEKDLNLASDLLKQAILFSKKAGDKVLSGATKLELIKLLIEQKKYDDAEKLLNEFDNNDFIVQRAQLNGFILQKKGKFSEALNVYEQANLFSGELNPYLTMQIQSLKSRLSL